MKSPNRSFQIRSAIAVVLALSCCAAVSADPDSPRKPFVHPGLLHSDADFARMKAKVDAGAHPWVDSWNILLANNNSSLDRKTNEVKVIARGYSPESGENYWRLMYDAAAAYQTALRWKISGDDRYADKSVSILNAWSSTLTKITGDPNACLALGLYGYQMANAAEIMRSYRGWKPEDFAKFQSFMLTVFYPGCHAFLERHCGTGPTRFWANWDLCNMDSIMAIGVLCDRRDIYDEAIRYFKTGVGNGNIEHAVYFMHPGYMGQWQEAGRDQGHTTLGVSLIGALCEMAWHQGDDLYGYENNRVLSGMEYIAKYNLGGDVPFVPYANPDTVQDHISNDGRGGTRPGWDLLFNHYVNIKGIAAPYTAQFAAKARPEGGGGNYGPNSGGFDQLGFTTLTATLDPIAEGAAPSCLSASVSGSKVTLSWWGSLGATSYIVRRASTSNSVFSTIGTVSETTYVDTTATVGEAYVYRVVAAFPGGKTKVSNLAAASLATKLVARYALNETVGTIAKNSVDRTFAATLMNGASWATAPHAVSLNGDKQYVALPDNIVSDLNDFTICAWVNVRTAKSWARIFDFGKGRVSYLYLGLKGTDGSLQFSITGGGGGGEERITGDTPLKLGEWHHVAVTIRDGTGTLYLDGKVIGTNPHMNLTPAQLGSSSRNFIGKSQYSDPDWDGYLDPYLDGEVADFRIYRGALTRDDVASLAAARPK